MKLKKIYANIKNVGVKEGLGKIEQKRIKLLNIFISNWFIIELVLITEDAINKEDPSLQILIHSGTILGLLIALFLQHKHKYQAARILFFSLILYSNFMFCNFAERGGYIEYFYIVVPVFLLLFTNNKYLIYSVFIISYLLFVIPINVFDIYPEGTFGSPILILIQFVIFFFLVQYFKNANIKSEEVLDNQRKQLQELNEFQSQFFINISHEIRTPLTLIKGEIDKLNFFEDTSYNSQSSLIKKGLNKQVDKIKKIVDDVLDLAKMKDSKFAIHTSVISSNQLLDKLYVSFEPLCTQKEIDFKLDKIEAPCWISTDAIYLERAIGNIIVNAIKYTPKKGSITLSLKAENEKVFISIKDTGIGISEKEIDLICNRFYQSKNDINKAGGSGVGLAFSKEIIELHKGKLDIKSTLNIGSTFTVILPRKLAPVKQEIVDKVNYTDDFSFNKPLKLKTTALINLLIVDDNFEMREYLKSILNSYNCLEAENGEEALEILSHHKIDFLITDYMMPVMDGLSLIENIKERKLDIPILMLTARTDAKSKLDVLRLGIDDYLNKPFEREELEIKIKNALSNYKNRKDFNTKEAIALKQETISSTWIKELEQYVYKNCGNINFTQKDIATHFNISKSSLNRKIKSETGLTPNQLITEVKLQKARRLLEASPDILLKTLALEVGFLHTSHFSKLYKVRFGIQPKV